MLGLPEVFRVPLVLLYVEDLSYRELADMLGCPVGTIMSRLHARWCRRIATTPSSIPSS